MKLIGQFLQKIFKFDDGHFIWESDTLQQSQKAYLFKFYETSVYLTQLLILDEIQQEDF